MPSTVPVVKAAIEKGKVDTATMAEIQQDTRNEFAETLVPALMEVDLAGLDREAVRDGVLAVFPTWTAGFEIGDESALEPFNAALRQLARQTDSLDYVTRLVRLQSATLPLDAAWDDIDVLLTPTGPPAWPAGTWLLDQETDPLDLLDPIIEVTSYTVVANIMGLPAMSLPVGRLKGLPVGGQFIGQEFLEDEMLEAAYALERAVPATEEG